MAGAAADIAGPGRLWHAEAPPVAGHPRAACDEAALNNVILLLSCFVIGMLLRQSGRCPDNMPASLNAFIIHVSLPALTLHYIHGLAFDPALVWPALMPWIMFAAGVAFFALVGRLLALSRPTTGCLMLVGSLANTSFIGLPMIEAYYGAQWMGIGIVADQLGSYLVLSVLGIFLASLYAAGERPTPRAIALRIAGFPPFVAIVLAFLLMPVPYPEWATSVLSRLGNTLAPIALVSVGYQLRLSAIRGRLAPLGAALAYKLVLGPALIMALLVGLLGQSGTIVQVTVFEAAMAPMVGAAIVAMDNDLDPSLATLLVGIGIPLSFLTLPVWFHVLQRV